MLQFASSRSSGIAEKSIAHVASVRVQLRKQKPVYIFWFGFMDYRAFGSDWGVDVRKAAAEK